MPPPYLPFKYCRSLLPTAVVLSLVVFWLVGSRGTRVGFAQGSPPVSFKNFEAPQIHPLALTPDGTRLLAVNTPNATLSVFQLVSGSPVLTAEIPVGFEPVSVAARNNREAWVVNWMSDSVSIVDLSTGKPRALARNADGNTGGALTVAERNDFANRLGNGTMTRAQVVRAVSENAEFTRREKNKAFVLMQYFGYLRRNPNDPPEAGLNFDGYNFWLAKLNQHNGNFIQAEMVKSFIVSGEYLRRFGL